MTISNWLPRLTALTAYLPAMMGVGVLMLVYYWGVKYLKLLGTVASQIKEVVPQLNDTGRQLAKTAAELKYVNSAVTVTSVLCDLDEEDYAKLMEVIGPGLPDAYKYFWNHCQRLIEQGRKGVRE